MDTVAVSAARTAPRAAQCNRPSAAQRTIAQDLDVEQGIGWPAIKE
jgi:hypothetical protein